MKELNKMPKIHQFRNVVTSINRLVNFTGLDGNGEATYDASIKKPTITFKGTVKIHGTNAGVSYNDAFGIWAQSKENVLTIEEDNYGFASFVESKRDVFKKFFDLILVNNDVDTSKNTITILGEWAGKGINKGVAISGMERTYFIFGIKVKDTSDENADSFWLFSDQLVTEDERIYNINEFESFSVDVDFNMPQLSQNKFVELCQYVEVQCPVGRALGLEGTGEGIVWVATYKGRKFRFKVKGEKHSSTKVKTLANVDIEKLNSITEFVTYAVTENRVDQAIQIVFKDGELDIKKMGDYIRWIINDITSEEGDTLKENNLNPKDVNKYLSNRARNMFLKKYNKF